MFGTFRVMLAVLVVLQHALPRHRFNYGDAAVINFFMISGYVMTILIKNNYGKLGKSTWYFYADRFIRIYPQYFFFIMLSFVLDSIFYFSPRYLSGHPTIGKFLLNAVIVPMNYVWVIPSLSRYQLLLPAWSLGLEEQFYWIFPFIVLLPFVERVSNVLSLAIFAVAIFGILNPELFAYRFLPGVIFIFLLGKNLADYNTTRSEESYWTMATVYTVVLVLTVGLWMFRPGILFMGYNKEVLLAILTGFPVICFLSRLPRRPWDEFLGHCSYGVFLGHITIIHLFVRFKIYEIQPFDRLWVILTALVLLSIPIGFAAYYLVEKPTLRFRYALRQKHAHASREANA
jgi:peptidoglycan/LPS O-acetylase OafA/YrhL